MRTSPGRGLLWAALATLSLWLAPLSAAEAQATCTTRTECLDNDIDLDDDPPVVTISSLPDTVTSPSHVVTFYFGDDNRLDPATATYGVTPGSFAEAPAWRWSKQYTSASAPGWVSLAPGANTITGRVCDGKGQCRSTAMQVFYKAPPPPPVRAAPALVNAYNGERRNLATCDACSETVVTYSTPSYTSLDQERSVTLFYSSNQARLLGYVEVDATDNSVEAPVRVSITVTNPWGWMVSPERFYEATTGTQRLAAMWDASGYGNGSSVHAVTVRSYWSDGSFLESTIPVRIVLIDQRNSRFGAGWSMAGLQHLYVQSDGVVHTDGAGTAIWFGAAATGYTTPVGEGSQLVYDAASATYTRSFPDGHRSVFTGDGYLSYVEDRFGSRTTYQWTTNVDGVRVLHRIVDAAGQATEFAYHAGGAPHRGKLASITDPAGRTTSFGYWDGWENLTDVQDAAGGSALKVTYDGSGHLATGWTDARGGRWDVAYDNVGRAQRLDAPAQSDGVTQGRQSVTIRSREAAVLPPWPASSSQPGSRVTPQMAQVWVTSSTGRVTRVSSDAYGNATRIETPSDTTVIRRNTRSQITQLEDREGNSVSYGYEAGYPYRLRWMTVQAPDGAVTQEMEYGAYSQPLRVTIGGVVFDYVLDALGRRTAIKRGTTTVASFAYDARGRVTSSTDAGGHSTAYAYQPAPGMQNLATLTTNGITAEFRRDPLGRTVQTVYAGRGSDSLSFDVLNRVTRVRDPAGGITEMGYVGSRPDLYQVTDALGQQYRLPRNTLGQVLRSVQPAGDSIIYTYQPGTGRLESITNRRGGTVALEYDARGRVIRRTADGTAMTWAYDPDGRWMAATSPVSTDTVRYDSDGKVTEEVSVRGGLRFSVRRTYTPGNAPDSVIVGGPWGTRSYMYSYDSHGRVDALRDYTGKWTHIKRNGENLPDSIRLPTAGAMRLAFTHTPEHRLAGIAAPIAALNHMYRYDARGRIMADSLRNGVNLYGYDALDRVAEWELHRYGVKRVCYTARECVMQETDSLVQAASFTWDATGNPAGAPRAAGNRLLSYGGYSMTYDADGNLTRKYDGAGFDQTFAWNTLGQLAGTTRAGAGSVAYDYDAFGRRVRRVEQATGAVTHFVYSGNDLALEVDGSGSLLREYAHYPGIDTPHSMRQWANGGGGAIYYYALQQPGHVNGLVNANDQLVNSYQYTPFGMTAAAVEGTSNPLRYMAREWDAATGLYYVRNRWYDPQLGRFVSEDPIGLAGGINAYVYAGNNPVSFRDPSGLCHDGGAYLTSGYSTGRLGSGSGYWEFTHYGEQYHGHAVGNYFMLCAPAVGQGGGGGPRGGGPGGGHYGAGGGGGRPGEGFRETFRSVAKLVACVAQNTDASVKYGATVGAEANLGVVSVGAEVDVGSLSHGTQGFALTQGWSLTGAAGVPGTGWAIGGKCGAERRMGWNDTRETEGCIPEASITGNEMLREAATGRVGFKAYAGVGVSANISIPAVLQCVAETP